MTVEQNVAILRSKARRAPADNKDRIEKIISLYSMRKIRDIRTAQIMVGALVGDEYRKNPNAVLDRYEVFVAKHGGAAEEEAQASSEAPTSSQGASERLGSTPPRLFGRVCEPIRQRGGKKRALMFA